MDLEAFLRQTALPQMEMTSIYLKPKIPQDKLVNAIRGYAPSIGMSAVVVLIDESFWGNAKEGALITNEKMILSEKLGGHVIQFSSIERLEFTERHLVVNDMPLATFSKPEVMPLNYIGALLYEYFCARRVAPAEQVASSVLDAATTEKIASFLVRFTEPVYFESVPADRRKLRAATVGYVLAENLTAEQELLIRFKCGFVSNEEVICVSWLGSLNSRDYFFCVTNRGVYSIRSSSEKLFLSHNDLQGLSAGEEYSEGRFIGVRLSSGQGLIVSIQNAYMQPYANELFSGLIEILNGRVPGSRISSREVTADKSVGQISKPNRLPASPLCGPQKTVVADTRAINQDEEGASRSRGSMIPFKFDGRDLIFPMLVKLNSIDNVGEFVGSFLSRLSNSKNDNSEIRKMFQSYVVRAVASFRREVVGEGGFSQFKNDLATLEISGAAMAFAFIQMMQRGVESNVAKRILLEGIRATFNLKTSVQSDPTGVALIKVVDSYVSNECKDLDDLFANIVIRLAGSNLSGKLCSDYSEVAEQYVDQLEDFSPTMDPGFSVFARSFVNDCGLLVDDILNVKW